MNQADNAIAINGRTVQLNPASWSRLVFIGDVLFPSHSRNHVVQVLISEKYEELLEKLQDMGVSDEEGQKHGSK
jgi:hypothetical protein